MGMAKKAKEFKLTTKQKIEGAEVKKRIADARVKEDKSIKQFPKDPYAQAQKAKNVRKAIDASKTAGRAKNVALKLKPKMTPEDAAMKKLLEKKYGKIYG